MEQQPWLARGHFSFLHYIDLKKHPAYIFPLPRWVKFEEDVEEGGNRWSKPHVATLSLHSLFELRSLLTSGTVCLDMAATSLDQIVDLTLDKMVNSQLVDNDQRECTQLILAQYHNVGLWCMGVWWE